MRLSKPPTSTDPSAPPKAAQPADGPGARCRPLVACVGDPNDPEVWSSTPFHFLREGRRQGVLGGGLILRPHDPRLRLARLLWNAGRLLQLDRPGGFQYSVGFLEALWAPVKAQVAGGAVVNHFQLYPPSVIHDRSIEKWFYLDGTLSLLETHYGQRPGRRIARDALALERAGYHAAAGVVTMSSFAANSVIRDYGVPPERVHVVVPGANLLPAEYDDWERGEIARRAKPAAATTVPGCDRPLRLVCVGKDWKRKGLDRLLRAIAMGRPRGLTATLRVVGCDRRALPPELQAVPGVEWSGYIPRRPDGRRFFDVVSECDVGCLLSTAELAGIALREYLAFGMPVIGPATGGSPDQMLPEASVAVPPDAPDERVLEILLRLEQRPAEFEQMRGAAWARRRSALWDQSVAAFARLSPSLTAGAGPAAATRGPSGL